MSIFRYCLSTTPFRLPHLDFIPDPAPGSGSWFFTCPGSRIWGSQRHWISLRSRGQKGTVSRIQGWKRHRIPDPGVKRAPDPGSRGQKGTGSRIQGSKGHRIPDPGVKKEMDPGSATLIYRLCSSWPGKWDGVRGSLLPARDWTWWSRPRPLARSLHTNYLLKYPPNSEIGFLTVSESLSCCPLPKPTKKKLPTKKTLQVLKSWPSLKIVS